jgi:uncharacterized membrane protein YvbJ
MQSTVKCNNCGSNLIYSSENDKWFCDNCKVHISPTQLMIQHIQPHSNIDSTKLIKKTKLVIIGVVIVFFILFFSLLFIGFSSRCDATIRIHSSTYNGYVKIYIGNDEKFSGWINEGETIEETFSLIPDEYTFTVSYEGGSQSNREAVHSDTTINFRI